MKAIAPTVPPLPRRHCVPWRRWVVDPHTTVQCCRFHTVYQHDTRQQSCSTTCRSTKNAFYLYFGGV